MDTIEATNSLQVTRTKIRLILSRVFGLSILGLLVLGSSDWSNAHLFDHMLFLLGVLLAIIGFCGRLWCHSYIAGRKKRVLITVGPYSLCRHPLYFFSLVGGLGLGLCTETLSVAILFVLAFAVYYPHIIRTEEAFLSANFSDYEEYKKRVPLFFPRWSRFADGDVMVNASHLRGEIMEAGGFLSSIGIFELLDLLHYTDVLPTYFEIL
ncbi:MAG TPA: isoprenylcysteine carboxylmethyltransferase family protein [Thermoanaerobaculia bacterium]|nr:isoprenylcysteine carboxylmethyltransferase family protein [Thermoanaerobaculia bacterium]